MAGASGFGLNSRRLFLPGGDALIQAGYLGAAFPADVYDQPARLREREYLVILYISGVQHHPHHVPPELAEPDPLQETVADGDILHPLAQLGPVDIDVDPARFAGAPLAQFMGLPGDVPVQLQGDAGVIGV